ncbi:MAG: tetratricopeptide repeat protein [Planctomycetaceae bacterium]|jgi:tetratricopeptide (TPR) repeat protein|nr:tetratricopeptide repeat protein [Planctomycetaceae bacterium]
MSDITLITDHYTLAMLAELLNVSAATVRQWYRRGWLRESIVVQKLPYFARTEILAAQRLAQLARSGLATGEIAKKLAALQLQFPDIERPIATLELRIDGRGIFLQKQGEMVDTVGQKLFNFTQQTESSSDDVSVNPRLSNNVAGESGDVANEIENFSYFDSAFQTPPLYSFDNDAPDKEELCRMAYHCEEQNWLAQAVEYFRAALAASGPDAMICFQLGELLYRLDDKNAARERYYMAIEIDENFVEARANLGCVLAETGELELAVSTFQGTLRYHPDYADVHYQLALVLQKLGKTLEAEQHLQRFRELTPHSPWAE